jgi:CRISPR-associated protein Cas8a1/Csx13
MTPISARDFVVASSGDAALAVEVALRAEQIAASPGCGGVHVVTMGRVPWDTKQKYRVATSTVADVPEPTLDFYDEVSKALPARVVVFTDEGNEGAEGQGARFEPSALRGFVAENLASGKPWYEGFSTARVTGKKPRPLHLSWKKGGALQAPERKSLMAMLSHLADAEASLVRSVHIALRQRFGQIAEECRANPAAMKNRFAGESDNWRLRFAGAKTPDQVRGALADLWSRAGSNAELRASWPAILDLFRQSQWQLVRDLALVALASYSGREAGVDVDSETEGE